MRKWPSTVSSLQPIWILWYSDTEALKIEDGGEITTAGEAEEPSGHTDRITHGDHPKPTPSLCSDTTFVPGEFIKARGLDEPVDWSAKRTPNEILALTDATY